MASRTHFDHLFAHVPSIQEARVLDLGSGKGAFVLEAASRGANVTGLETSEAYLEIARSRIQNRGISATFVKGVGEDMPFPDEAFDFVNICEVIEHVEDPERVLREVHRVLVQGGHAYLSAPNRFGWRDQHFHLYFVNWLPRSLADSFISMFGTHKDYGDSSAGRQRLASMHYYTYGGIVSLARRMGFTVLDIRKERIARELPVFLHPFAFVLYRIFRFFYFDSFHLLLEKPDSSEKNLRHGSGQRMLA